jgi:hypothetical protein
VVGAGVAIIVASCALCASGVVRSFHVTGGSMAPEIAPGDSVASADSLDSPACGFLSAQSVLGRMCFCYWPPKDAEVLR